ncbi:MAG: T9SS type A sorting domain-containing protein [Bacteroidota bacterium]
MKKVFTFLLLFTTASLSYGQFINEFHYDNVGGDVGEFVEVFIPSGDANGYSVVLYNGSNGTQYDTDAVPACVTVQSCGATGDGCFLLINYPTNGIQNGGPDGIALVRDDNTVIEFISYEGTFTATNGPANGLTSTDVGVSETSSTPIGNSIQRTGTLSWEANVGTPGGCNSAQLPVELVSFTATPVKNLVSLEWQTATEINNDYFVVEHSVDGKNFKDLEMVLGAGNAAAVQNYSYLHETPSNGSNYYRLRQVDFDGTASYSAVEIANLKEGKEFRIYPTLTKEFLQLEMPGLDRQEVRIDIFHLSGQLVRSYQLDGGIQNERLDVHSLEAGHYILRLQQGNTIENARFVKL